MRKGERTSGDTASDAAPIGRALVRLGALIGGLDTPELKARVAAALALTLLSKVLVVWAPLILGDAVNALAAGAGPQAQAGTAAGAVGQGLLWVFAGSVALWALVRFAGSAAPQVRDTLFQPVSEEAQRRAGVRVFGHVHALSVSFHQGKRTGAVWRTIERGVRAIDFLTRFVAFNIGPTLLELALAATVLGLRYGLPFALIAVATVAVYAGLTLAITEWRLRYRREMNEADSEANARAVDSLLNFETVKAFSAEARETARYDMAVSAYARASSRSNATLQGLNLMLHRSA
jgi:ATP-binding cassette, subfamily B, heavy metal transporter